MTGMGDEAFQPAGVEARRLAAQERALAHARSIPEGHLGGSDAVRLSGLGGSRFIAAVMAGRVRKIRFGDDYIAFLREDVEALRTAPA